MVITAYGMAAGSPVLAFNIAYLFLIISLFFLEKFMPFESAWEKPDGQTFASIAHTISSKGTVQLLLLWGGVIGLSELMKPMTEPLEYGIWPRNWPLFVQVILGLYVAEFGLYWAHRIAHVTPFFWRFHAIHHSVTKLWFVNTGRFHFLDSLWKIALSLTPLLLMGAPMEVIQWISAITAFIGLLTHCNVDMKCGVLNYIFSTPELHRWHHSRDLAEGNRNYGENIIL
ncbi:MAG TPA: sterol desaturase family protein, partial [Alphaproteobacteria bacterium]|nr:sterol desaturase family protein [Alphaproteobacteria bacterium]